MSESSRLDDLRTLRVAMLDVAAATAFVTLVGGSFLIGYVKDLGGSDRWVGLISSIPGFMGLMQIPGAVYGRSFTSYKRFVGWGGGMWRILHLGIVLLPFLPLANEAKLSLLVLAIILAAACTQSVDPIYNDWLAEIIPADSRGWFYGRRGAIAAITGAIVGLAGGGLLDFLKRQNLSEEGYGIVFGVGWSFAVISWIFFLKMQDRVRVNPQRVQLRSAIGSILAPYKDSQFRPVLLFLAVFVFGQAFMGGLLTAYSFETLKLPMTALQLMGLTHAAGNLIMARWWGFFADKYGNKPVLFILAFGVVLSPLAWFYTRPEQDTFNVALLMVSHLFGGMIWGGVGAVQLNLVVSSARPDQRANYIAAGQSLITIIAGISPMLGAELMFHLRHMWGDAGRAYLWVLGATTALRLISIVFLIPVREDGSVGLRQTLSQLKRARPSSLGALRKLSEGKTVDERHDALSSLATQRVALAVDEIVKMLHDPTPRLRRQAAWALARIGDSAAAEALRHQLEEHPNLVEEETIMALGRLGGEEGVEVLTRYLTAPRPQFRRAAARALAQVGGPKAEQALLTAATQVADPDSKRAAIQALRDLGSTQADQVLADACRADSPGVRIAAAEAIAELGIVSAVPSLVESLQQHHDEACSEVAYALAAVGTSEHIPILMQVANETNSMTTRRRVLLGIARILGVEKETYRLLLLEGLNRDQKLLEFIGSASKSSSKLRESLELYSTGHEHEAVHRLAAGQSLPLLKALADPKVDEVFLVAVMYFVQEIPGKSRRQ